MTKTRNIKALETAAFQTEIELALGWADETLTLKTLASELGSTVSRVRYHVGKLSQSGRVELSKDGFGRVLVSLPGPVDLTEEAVEDHGRIVRVFDGKDMGPASALQVARAERRAAKLGRAEITIVLQGFQCWIEPPFHEVGSPVEAA